MIGRLPKFADENLLVGFDTSDDACVYKIREDLAAIQTVDFFPPVVDDPYLYGQIAASNSLSDVYAMGGTPSFALNLLCIPSCLSLETVSAILEGGYNKVQEAGAVVAGGHTIEDVEPKYGLCVTGFIHPKNVWSNAGAREGDILLLTKPVGSGVAVTAAKADLLNREQLQNATDTMAALNKYSRDALAELPVHACTDVTGFGLLGHAFEMAAGSKVALSLHTGAIPLLPGVADWASMGIIPQGAYTNKAYLKDKTDISASVPEYLRDLLVDPQTSGGLLVALPEKEVENALKRLMNAGVKPAIIGEVLSLKNHAVIVD